jgi:ABC-2 type transport system permease protein
VGETKIHYRIILLPVAIGLQFLLSVGLGLILAPVTVLFTDMPRIVRIALRMGFYFTPIIYGVHAAPPVLQKFLILNPMAGILEMYRAGFFPQELNVAAIVSSVIITFVTLVAGTIVFKRLEAPVLKEI